ncbi:hypothetical protein CROQUDRAFT_99802 [Cronartium quercuum f. sp. fusiforme G11]|uniref:Uncharacterized protein n=1 Tax=Cronartium quercuum f. sp. fusiforme G11 TaxID=708437 RepID=A0A9P6NAX0_9BASI|nr:hypothetical protein CROQUDRAFT_99802 [Cronartium quercuum f. sp. fusiforme G11]
MAQGVRIDRERVMIRNVNHRKKKCVASAPRILNFEDIQSDKNETRQRDHMIIVGQFHHLVTLQSRQTELSVGTKAHGDIKQLRESLSTQNELATNSALLLYLPLHTTELFGRWRSNDADWVIPGDHRWSNQRNEEDKSSFTYHPTCSPIHLDSKSTPQVGSQGQWTMRRPKKVVGGIRPRSASAPNRYGRRSNTPKFKHR